MEDLDIPSLSSFGGWHLFCPTFSARLARGLAFGYYSQTAVGDAPDNRQRLSVGGFFFTGGIAS